MLLWEPQKENGQVVHTDAYINIMIMIPLILIMANKSQTLIMCEALCRVFIYKLRLVYEAGTVVILNLPNREREVHRICSRSLTASSEARTCTWAK